MYGGLRYTDLSLLWSLVFTHALVISGHLLSQSMGVGKRATDQTHFESSRLAKRQRIHGLPHLEETIADNQSDRSFTAEPIIDNQSHLLLRDTRTCFMPDVSMPVSLPSSIDLNHTQTSHSDNVPFLEARSETFSDSGVGSEVTLSGGGHSVAGPQNLAHDTGRLQHAATHVADEESKLNQFVYQCCLLIILANSLDPDQARRVQTV